MTSSPLVSIALCTYNGEKFLSEQIESILSQTYLNIEIIIVDDNSNDNTISIIKNNIKKSEKIKLYKNETNLGFIKNFEKAINLCHGDYILLSDQDDIWQKEKIQYLLDNIKTNTSLIYSNASLVDSNLKSIQNKTLVNKENFIEGNNNLYFIFNNCVSGNTIMFRKTLKQYILPFPKNISFHDIWIAFVAASIGKIQYLDKPLVLYRQHSSNITDVTKTKIKCKKSLKEKFTKKANSMKEKKDLLIDFDLFLQKKYPQNINKTKIQKITAKYSDYKKYFFNFQLFYLIIKYRKLIFMPKKQKKLLFIAKIALGLKAYKLFPFL